MTISKVLKQFKKGVKNCVEKGSFPARSVFFASKKDYTVLYYEFPKDTQHYWKFETLQGAVDLIEKINKERSNREDQMDFDHTPFTEPLILWFPRTDNSNCTSPEISVSVYLPCQSTWTPCRLTDHLNHETEDFDDLTVEVIEKASKIYQDFVDFELEQC